MKIILGTFKDEGAELAEFLEPRIGAKPEVSGGELTFEDDSIKKTLRARHVKTYVKRFLWKKGERRNYRVLVEGKELRLIELEPSEAEEEERKKEEEREKSRKEEEPEKTEKEEAQAPAPEPPKETPVETPKAETPVEEEKKKPAAPKEPRKKAKKSAGKAKPSASA
jgi:hypothetical protein